MKSIPEGYEGKAEPIKGSLSAVIETIHQKGYKQLYIDGGVTVQSFLKEDLIDEIMKRPAYLGLKTKRIKRHYHDPSN
jgi:riboflavin biosynthesis pyrimidine reductase